MKSIILKDYGIVLTGRSFGHQVYKALEKNITYPVCLDFQMVESMGSSFGEEIVIPVAQNQENKIYIKNANRVILSCLNDITEEKNFEIKFVDEKS